MKGNEEHDYSSPQEFRLEILAPARDVRQGLD
jgi:hypothetical protein